MLRLWSILSSSSINASFSHTYLKEHPLPSCTTITRLSLSIFYAFYFSLLTELISKPKHTSNEILIHPQCHSTRQIATITHWIQHWSFLPNFLIIVLCIYDYSSIIGCNVTCFNSLFIYLTLSSLAYIISLCSYGLSRYNKKCHHPQVIIYLSLWSCK